MDEKADEGDDQQSSPARARSRWKRDLRLKAADVIHVHRRLRVGVPGRRCREERHADGDWRRPPRPTEPDADGAPIDAPWHAIAARAPAPASAGERKCRDQPEQFAACQPLMLAAPRPASSVSPLSEEQQHQRQPDRHFGRSHGQDEEEHHLAVRPAPSARPRRRRQAPAAFSMISIDMRMKMRLRRDEYADERPARTGAAASTQPVVAVGTVAIGLTPSRDGTRPR